MSTERQKMITTGASLFGTWSARTPDAFSSDLAVEGTAARYDTTERYLKLVLRFSENPTKLFVGGLSWKTTSRSMRNYFKQFGMLIECSVLYDEFQRSRGFGFVTFASISSVVKVLKGAPHTIDGRVVDAKPSKADSEARVSNNPALPNQHLKIFVGGLPYFVNNYDIKCFFDLEYGGVLDAAVMYCQATQTSRGFAFVQFGNQTSMERVLDDRWVFIRGARCECKPALPRIRKPLYLTPSSQDYDPEHFEQDLASLLSVLENLFLYAMN